MKAGEDRSCSYSSTGWHAVSPGAIPAGFSVGTQGDANYSIPISVPPGTGGLKPNLALSYNHLSGNGLAGMRWTLSGISAISRCPQTFAQDSVAGMGDDRYCLNGQRLVNVDDGLYHANGTRYRTEIESFQRIVQVGPQTGVAQSFYVDHGNGLRSYFGETPNSRVAGPGSTIRTWYISRTVDLFGNTIEYSYYSPTAGEVLPQTITWTGNSTTSPTLSPRYAATITYENRPADDQRSGYYSGGGAWSRTKRIDRIDVTYQAASIATYELSYGTPAATGTGRSQLAEVSVCRGSACLPETVFTVQDGTRGWYNLVTTGQTVSAYPLIGDWNGDGRQDVFVSLSNTWRVHPGQANGTLGAAVNSSASSTTNPGQARVIDYNGDGLSDLLYQSASVWYVVPSTGTGFGTPLSTSISTSAVSNPVVIDFDGDGLSDIVYEWAGALYGRRNQGGSFATQQLIFEPTGAVMSAVTFVADITGSGTAQILRTSGSVWYIHKEKSDLADVVTAFTDGLGRTISVEYESLAQAAAYTLDLSHVPPTGTNVRRYGGARYVVTTETHDDGLGGTRDVLHEYDTAFVNTAGRGWQSFREHTVTDVAQGTYTLTQYSQTFPAAGMPISVEQRTVSGDKLIRSVASTLPTPAQMELSGSSTPPRQFPRVEKTTTVEKEVFGPNDGATLRTVEEEPTYDLDYGYVTSVTRTVRVDPQTPGWGSTTIFDRSVIDDTGVDQWCLGLPGTVETSQSLPGGSPQVRTVEYQFNSDCRLDTVTDLSDTLDTSKQLETSYGFDQFGNVTAVSEYSVAAPSAARTTTIGYDGAGQLPTSVTIDSAGLNLTTTLGWDYLLGLRSSITGPDSLTTSFQYDAFGRLTKETRPAGYTDITYRECVSCFPQYAAYFVHAEDSGGGEQYTFFDHLGRAVGSDTALRGGARSREEVRYLATGQAEKTSLPYVAGESVFWVSYDYDGIGRLIEEDAPISEAQGSGAVTSYEYLGHTLKVTDPENHATQYIHNALGQINQVIDALGGDTLYSYHPFGELHQVTDDASNVTTILYDPRGFKSDLYDPDMGHWTYEHNAFGELIWQEDAKGQEVDLFYDKAGRLDYRVETEGTTNWSYYTSGTGRKGRLEEVTGPGGLEEAYVYSSTHGALTQVTRTIGAKSYTFDYAFDSHGRLIEMTYPENVHQARFGVEYAYDGWGTLEQVYNAATPSLVYYTADSQDALGRARQATLGNGLVEKLGYSRATGRLVSIKTGPAQTATLQDLAYDWDLAGNLIERFDDNLNQTDVFTYDALNRLEEVERDSSTILTLTYNALGNIVTKSDLTGTYAYGAGSAGPHAVTSIGTMTFGYDLNGNMTT